MPSKGSKPRERTLTFSLKQSQNYVAANADGGTVVLKADDIGAMVQLNFLRGDNSPTTEKVRAVEDGPQLRVISPSEFDAPMVKYVECSVLMRPDHALAIAAAIVQNIQQLPPHLRALYRIPDVSMIDQAPLL
jgi:hypothetical protein